MVVITGKGNSTEEGGKKPNIYKFNADGGYAIGMAISANRLFSVITDLKSKILDKISLFSIKRETEIKYSELDDKAGVLGAASFVLSRYFE